MNENHIAFKSYLVNKTDKRSQLLLKLIKAVEEFNQHVEGLKDIYTKTGSIDALIAFLNVNETLILHDANLGEIIDHYKREEAGKKYQSEDLRITVYTFSSN